MAARDTLDWFRQLQRKRRSGAGIPPTDNLRGTLVLRSEDSHFYRLSRLFAVENEKKPTARPLPLGRQFRFLMQRFWRWRHRGSPVSLFPEFGEDAEVAAKLAGKGSGVFFGQRLRIGRRRWPKKTPDPFTIQRDPASSSVTSPVPD